MGLGDDRVSGCYCGGKVASADAVEGEGKVIGAEDDDGADGREVRADIFFEVEGGVAPGLLASRGCGLTKLVGGARKLDVFETRAGGKSGLFGGGCDDGGSVGFDVGGVG